MTILASVKMKVCLHDEFFQRILLLCFYLWKMKLKSENAFNVEHGQIKSDT